MTCDSTRNRIKVSRPAATRLKFVRGFVEGCIAAGTGVDARGRLMFVIFTCKRSFGALLTEYSELFFEKMSVKLWIWWSEIGCTFRENGLPFIVGFLEWVRHVLRR